MCVINVFYISVDEKAAAQIPHTKAGHDTIRQPKQ